MVLLPIRRIISQPDEHGFFVAILTFLKGFHHSFTQHEILSHVATVVKISFNLKCENARIIFDYVSCFSIPVIMSCRNKKLITLMLGCICNWVLLSVLLQFANNKAIFMGVMFFKYFAKV